MISPLVFHLRSVRSHKLLRSFVRDFQEIKPWTTSFFRKDHTDLLLLHSFAEEFKYLRLLRCFASGLQDLKLLRSVEKPIQKR